MEDLKPVPDVVSAYRSTESWFFCRQTGREILERHASDGWGSKVVERLAQDRRTKGIPRTNLLSMRSFAESWPDEEIVQQVVGPIPRGPNVRILDLVKDPAGRLWSIQPGIQQGRSRRVLVTRIESGFHRRQGKATTNFRGFAVRLRPGSGTGSGSGDTVGRFCRRAPSPGRQAPKSRRERPSRNLSLSPGECLFLLECVAAASPADPAR